MGDEGNVTIATRVPARVKEELDKLVTADMHTNLADWLRDIIREKIQDDHPDIYKLLTEGKK